MNTKTKNTKRRSNKIAEQEDRIANWIDKEMEKDNPVVREMIFRNGIGPDSVQDMDN